MKKYIAKIYFILIFLFFANGVFGANGVSVPTNVGLPQGTLLDVISNFTKWLLAIFGFLAIISFVVTGIMYLTAAGDEDQQKKAKRQMTWSILGVIVGLSGYVVIRAVDAWLKGGSTF